MKILHSCDWHLRHKHKYTSLVEGKIWDRLFEEKMKILQSIPIAAKKYEVDCVVITGDIFDTTNPPEAIKAEFCKLMFKFSSSRIGVYIIPGNHETSSLGNHVLMDIGTAFNSGDYIYVMKEGALPTDVNKVGLFHDMLDVVSDMYKKTVSINDEKFKPFKTILLGDYHSYWKKSYAGRFYTYSGSPYPTRFGETNHSVSLLSVTDEGVTESIKRIQLKSYQMIETDKIDRNVSEWPFDTPAIIKYNVKVKPEKVKSAMSICSQIRNHYLSFQECLDFVYTIKAKDTEKEKEDVQNRSVEDVAFNYIKNNCPYPNEAEKEFKEILTSCK